MPNDLTKAKRPLWTMEWPEKAPEAYLREVRWGCVV